MRTVLFLSAALGVWMSFEARGEKSDTSSMQIQKPFHLLTFKCEPENAAEAETTPQSPPLGIDDPGTPGCNTWEINIVTEADIMRRESSWDVPLFDINYGIGDNLQLKYEIPYVSAQPEDGPRVSAMGESKAGIKYMFLEDKAAKLQLAVYPQITFVSGRSEAVQKGLASSGSITTLPILMAHKLGETSLGDINMTVNLAYNISTKADTTDFFSGAVGMGVPARHGLAVMAELALEHALSGDAEGVRSQLLKSKLGLIATLNKKFLILGSMGHSLYSSDHLDHSYVLAGIRILEGGTSK